jgi:hypothetical protein
MTRELATCVNCGETIELIYNVYHPTRRDYAVWFHASGPTERNICAPKRWEGKQKRQVAQYALPKPGSEREEDRPDADER